MSESQTQATIRRDQITEPPVSVTAVASVAKGSYTDVDGWSLSIPTDLDFEVKPGMVVEHWGKGLGFTVRGLAIDGHVIRYRTEAEQEREDALWSRRRTADQIEAYVENKSRQDEQYAALPAEFQRRLDRFRAGCPEFRWEFEPYELSICLDAVKIAERFGRRADLISEFQFWDYERQKAEVDFDQGHSGNSFSCAVLLARMWCIDPESVVYAHGGLVPLVGCETYGCTHDPAPEPEPAIDSSQDRS